MKIVPTMVRMAALTAIAGFLTACDGAPTSAPLQQSEGLRPPFDAAASTGPNFLLAGDIQTSITVDPTRTRWYQLGAHWVYIPSGAVCEPGSSYGASEWDKACVSAVAPITIPVVVGERDGHAMIEFGTDLRFKPTADPYRAVYLFIRENGVGGNRGSSFNPSQYAVLWAGSDNVWINEAASDPSLRAFRVGGRWVGRRVKHFSGYNVSLGLFVEQLDPTIRVSM